MEETRANNIKSTSLPGESSFHRLFSQEAREAMYNYLMVGFILWVAGIILYGAGLAYASPGAAAFGFGTILLGILFIGICLWEYLHRIVNSK